MKSKITIKNSIFPLNYGKKLLKIFNKYWTEYINVEVKRKFLYKVYKHDKEIKNELIKGLERQDVRMFCAVALYSQTKDTDYLRLAKRYKPRKVSFPELGQFLKQFNNSKARSLGDKLIK